ncbi:hypothetical protein K7432_000181 [Basidiobolus ranarum]|uniref:Uncharacterized protein n=1 Tax=Basidiobolus ranarum TaxID=34480 RepID=A0ABR2X5E6_9FUNG
MSLRIATLRTVLQTKNSILQPAVTSTRQYTSISSSLNDAADQEHHNFLANILTTSSDADWSSVSVQNHNVVAPISTPMEPAHNVLWEDLIQE